MSFRRSYFLALSLLATAGCQQADTCEEGSDGQCAPPAAAAAQRVRLTHLDVNYDLSQPVYVNNRVPITFGITSESLDGAAPAPRHVAVTFSFVEESPSDPKNPLGCSSSAIDVEVTGDGTEQIVDGFIWPTSECGSLAAKHAAVNLQVDFDGGAGAAAELGSNLDAPTVLLSEAHRGDAVNQLCRAKAEGAPPNVGCVNAFDIQPTPTDANGALIDVRYALSSSSSVAIVPFQPTTDTGPSGPPDVAPTLVVQSRFVVNGRDPYISGVEDPSTIPDELLAAVPTIKEDLKFGLSDAALAALSALPGKAAVSYTLSAASDGTTQLPLTIGDPENSANKLAEAIVTHVVPGTANDVAHELYLPDVTLAAVSAGGVWANQSDFVVRGCFKADFAQGGNEGDAGQEDCRDLKVVLVRETAAASAASSRSFDKAFERNLGSSRIAINSSMSTQNHLDLNGASSTTEGKVVLKGKIGKSFELTLARAFGNANLNIDPTKTSYEVGVEAFGKSIFSDSKQAAKIVQTQDFSASKSFTLANLGFGFGPVTIGIKIGVGGTLGFEAEDTLEVLTDGAACQDLLKSGDTIAACGRMTRVTTPVFGLTGKLEGGIDLKIVKAGVAADLRFVTLRFPLETTLGFGLTDQNKMLVRGDATWDMALQPLSGNVYIYGKVGIGWFKKSLKVNLFSFSSPTIKTRLMSASMASFEELQ